MTDDEAADLIRRARKGDPAEARKVLEQLAAEPPGGHPLLAALVRADETPVAPGPLAAGVYHPTERLIELLRAGPQACVHRADGTVLAVCGPAADPRSVADARLFAAAPGLLAACRELLAYELGCRGGLSTCVRLAQAAVARATGEGV